MNEPAGISKDLTTLAKVCSAPSVAANLAEPQVIHQKAVMIFAGEQDISCREQFGADLKCLINVQAVVLDFTDVTFVDSTIVGQLIKLHNIRSSQGYDRVTIVTNNPNLIRLFSILQLDAVFNFAASLSDMVQPGEFVDVLYAKSGLGAPMDSRPQEYRPRNAANNGDAHESKRTETDSNPIRSTMKSSLTLTNRR